MKRFVDTSVGRVVLDFYGDGVVSVTLLDDEGWEREEGEWGDAEIAKALFYVAGVPEDEGEAIEERILPEYERRGGSPKGRWENGDRLASMVGGSLVLSFLATFAVGLATIVRYFARWRR